MFKYVVMELNRGEFEQVLPKNWKEGYDTEQEAETELMQYLGKMGGLLGDLPNLFIMKTFKENR